MSALGEQHAAWVEARDRLWKAPRKVIALPPPEPVAEPVRAPSCPETPSQRIVREVCAKHGVERAMLLGSSRTFKIAAARHETAFRMLTELDVSYPWIAHRLDRDHTSILNSVRRYIERTSGAKAILIATKRRQKRRKAQLWDEAMQLARQGLAAKQIAGLLPISTGRAQRAIRASIEDGVLQVTAGQPRSKSGRFSTANVPPEQPGLLERGEWRESIEDRSSLETVNV